MKSNKLHIMQILKKCSVYRKCVVNIVTASCKIQQNFSDENTKTSNHT